MRVALVVAFVLTLAGCDSLRPQQFEGATPQFDPIQYLEGPTRSWRVFENRRGEPRRRFRTAMIGVRDGDARARQAMLLTSRAKPRPRCSAPLPRRS